MPSDIDKIKIEVLRDATKDVADTLRALDRKTSYIITLTIFVFGGFLITLSQFNRVALDVNFLLDSFPLVYLVFALFSYYYSYKPISDPSHILWEKDKSFAENKYFCFHSDKNKKDAEKTATAYFNDITTAKDMARLLYIEIFKLSNIRENRISYINKGNTFFLIGVLFILAEVITLFSCNLVLFIFSLIAILLKFLLDFLKSL